jgi:hypothetical protein
MTANELSADDGERFPPSSPPATLASNAPLADISAIAFAAMVTAGDSLPQAGALLPPPSIQDHVVFLRGLPVAPWIPLRPAAEVWTAWLARLRELFLEAQTPAAGRAGLPSNADILNVGWQAWQEAHVHSVEARHVAEGIGKLTRLLGEWHAAPQAGGDRGAPVAAHLIGHSVGGAVVLTYLAGLRARTQSMPPVRIRAVLTLDAAVSGLAGVWSGAKTSLRRVTGEGMHGLQGLNAWAADQGIRVLTTTNERDAWSHRPLADLPYLGVRVGPAFAWRDQFNGRVHGWLRRTPEFVQAIWGPLPPPIESGEPA